MEVTGRVWVSSERDEWSHDVRMGRSLGSYLQRHTEDNSGPSHSFLPTFRSSSVPWGFLCLT